MMSSAYHGQDELPSPSIQKRATDDGDSGFHELMDDPATFELLVLDGRSSSPSQAQLQRMHRQMNHVGNSPASNVAYSTSTTPEYSPMSPSPRIVGNESVSSTNTQPDGGMSPAAAVEPGDSGETNLDRPFFSTSPTASEEDVSEKGYLLFSFVTFFMCIPTDLLASNFRLVHGVVRPVCVQV